MKKQPAKKPKCPVIYEDGSACDYPMPHGMESHMGASDGYKFHPLHHSKPKPQPAKKLDRCPVIYAEGDQCTNRPHSLKTHDGKPEAYAFHPKYHTKKPAKKAKKKAAPRDEFMAGVVACLYVIDFCDPNDSSRIYNEIIKSFGPAQDFWNAAAVTDHDHLKRHKVKGKPPVEVIP